MKILLILVGIMVAVGIYGVLNPDAKIEAPDLSTLGIPFMSPSVPADSEASE